MMRAKNTAHESIFKFHWKKMWPFSLIWPQVDFVRIVRLMDELRKNVVSQKALIKEAKSKAKPYEKTFLDTVPAYLDNFDTSCKCLADVAQWKQDMLEKKLHHDVKMIRDVSEYNNILKAYEKAQNDLVQAGAFVRAGWVEVIQGITKEGEDKISLTKQRKGQDYFRRMILANYGGRCALTGIDIPQLLLASHIIPWADKSHKKDRLNPCNGICLSALYDKAFDQGLITISPDNYSVILSSALQENETKAYYDKHFGCIKGQKLTLLTEYLPSREFLAYHRDKVFVGV